MLTKVLWDKVGISFDAVQSGAHANIFNGYQDYTPENGPATTPGSTESMKTLPPRWPREGNSPRKLS